LNTGVVRSIACECGVIRLSLTKPIGWTEKHKAFSWHAGGVSALAFLEAESSVSDLAFALPDHSPDGISLFYGATGLGNAFLASKPTEAVRDFLGDADDWCARLELAVAARLPILAPDAAEAVTTHLHVAGSKTLSVLCRLRPDTATSHIVGKVLGTWEPKRKLSEAIVSQFVKTLQESPRQYTILDRVVADAPCAAIRIMAFGCNPLSRVERARILFAVATRSLPKDVHVPIASSLNGRMDTAVESELLERAMQATRLDRNFLLAKEVGLAALAWESVLVPQPCQNLETALCDAPVRRWLGVHLLARLATTIC
jgi:hypothetical protein